MIVSERLKSRSNDYSKVEQWLFDAFRVQLVDSTVERPTPASLERALMLSVSVVVPAFRSESTLELLLDSLEFQTYLDYAPDKMEVVIVDASASMDRVLPRRRYPMILVRMMNPVERSDARNFGVLFARNDLLLLMDSDTIAALTLVESHAVRQKYDVRVLLTSFREHIEASHPAAERNFVRTYASGLRPDYTKDWRYKSVNKMDGKQYRSLVDTGNWKTLGFAGRYYQKSLPDMVVGACLSVRRAHYEEVGGFSPEFRGWGREDAFFGAMSIAAGSFVAPCLDAIYHIRHAPHSGSLTRQTEEWTRNAAKFNTLLDSHYERLAAAGRSHLADLRLSAEIAEVVTIPPLGG